MTPRRIEQFLATLAAELGVPARAYLTGAAAAALWGRVRPSLDVDLGVELAHGSGSGWAAVQGAIDRTTMLTGIPANVAEDIDRWGMITLLDYRRSSRRYKRFGSPEVRAAPPRQLVDRKIDPLPRSRRPRRRGGLPAPKDRGDPRHQHLGPRLACQPGLDDPTPVPSQRRRVSPTTRSRDLGRSVRRRHRHPGIPEGGRHSRADRPEKIQLSYLSATDPAHSTKVPGKTPSSTTAIAVSRIPRRIEAPSVGARARVDSRKYIATTMRR